MGKRWKVRRGNGENGCRRGYWNFRRRASKIGDTWTRKVNESRIQYWTVRIYGPLHGRQSLPRRDPRTCGTNINKIPQWNKFPVLTAFNNNSIVGPPLRGNFGSCPSTRRALDISVKAFFAMSWKRQQIRVTFLKHFNYNVAWTISQKLFRFLYNNVSARFLKFFEMKTFAICHL